MGPEPCNVLFVLQAAVIMDRSELLIVMTRFPVPGRCKTRLIDTLGEAGAARLSAALTSWTLRSVEELRASRDVAVEIHHEGGSAAEMSQMFGSAWYYIPQLQGDLGVRISGAAHNGFALGYRRVVVIGTDCPSLDATTLTLAFERLRKFPVVCGPSLDGGYYLIGLSRAMPHLFRGIPWGTDAVWKATIVASRESAHEIHRLKTLSDVDTAADLAQLPPTVWKHIADAPEIPYR